MRWRTYDRLLEKFDRYDEVLEAESWRQFAKITGLELSLGNRFRFEINHVPASVFWIAPVPGVVVKVGDTVAQRWMFLP